MKCALGIVLALLPILVHALDSKEGSTPTPVPIPGRHARSAALQPITNTPVYCKTTKLGKEYYGTVSTTRSGRNCQAWRSQSPHKHSQSAGNFPSGSLSDAGNHCRNPDSEPEGPWCYTTDSNKKWEYCDVPTCPKPVPVSCTTTRAGREYAGTVSTTVSGRTCQAWTSQSPHKHDVKNADRMPDATLRDASNYCRNPDTSSAGPWCYTTDPDPDKRWEYCNIPFCAEPIPAPAPPKPRPAITSTPVYCKTTKLGKEYYGSVARTLSGKTCQAWRSQSPHRHSQSGSNMPDKSLSDAANFCRNPDSESEGPWCYTTESRRWEYCDIPTCPKPAPVQCRMTVHGREYAGTLSKTKSGRTCQAWASQSPHDHDVVAGRLPEGSLKDAANYCRNPDTTSAPWCYTTDPDCRWEFCDIPLCPVPIDCYYDSENARAMPGHLTVSDTLMTPMYCVAHCHKLGYSYAGVQNGRECWCDNKYDKYPRAISCTVPCSGDPNQRCGGVNSLMVYGTKGEAES